MTTLRIFRTHTLGTQGRQRYTKRVPSTLCLSHCPSLAFAQFSLDATDHFA